ncbi:unnamed protein product [Linum trigynum]|uniref:Gnk2-homologous domain-containing protein n=1 Tax=Linum trigynum TaxID=586398 RepID=A0AAV2E2U8_9ROSI
MASFLTLLFPLLAIITVVPKTVVKAAPDLTYISALCSQKRDPNPPKLRNLALQATDLAIDVVSPGTAGNCGTVLTDPDMFGFGSCPTSGSDEDCTACLKFAQDWLLNTLCKNVYGGQITLAGCFLRFETYNFCLP